MNELTNIANGLVVICGLHLKRQAPAFRNDSDYEDKVLQICSEYIDFAIEKQYAVLFLDDCLKHVTVKQALMLMQFKSKTPLFIHKNVQHTVNPALIDMHCVEVLEEDAYRVGGKVVAFNESIDGADKYVTKNDGSWKVISKNPKNIKKTYEVPHGIAHLNSLPPASLIVNGNISCSVYESSVDDEANVVEATTYLSVDEKHYEFTSKLRELSLKKSKKLSDGEPGLQGLIHSLEMGDAKDRIIALYDQVSSEANEVIQ